MHDCVQMVDGRLESGMRIAQRIESIEQRASHRHSLPGLDRERFQFLLRGHR